jgi:hypothetical protein
MNANNAPSCCPAHHPDEPKRIVKLRTILAEHQAERVDGVLVDVATANAVLVVWEGLNADNRRAFVALPMGKAALLAWKLVAP